MNKGVKRWLIIFVLSFLVCYVLFLLIWKDFIGCLEGSIFLSLISSSVIYLSMNKDTKNLEKDIASNISATILIIAIIIGVGHSSSSMLFYRIRL